MPLLSFRFVQRTVKRTPYPHGITGTVIRLPYNGIHPPEPKAWYPAQLEGTFFQKIHTGRPKMLVDLQRRLRRQLKGRKKRHDAAQHPALRIRSPDILQFVFCDPPDLQKTFRVIFQYIQRICTEFRHNFGGGLFPDAFDQAGA